MLRLLLLLASVVSAPPPSAAQVHVAVPRADEVWDGRVRGSAPPGSRLVVRAGGRRWQLIVAADGRFDAALRRVPIGDLRPTVGGRAVGPVYGLPAGSIAALPRPHPDRRLNRRLAALAAVATPHVAIYSRSWSGRAAAYNAGAEFEAASTLKLPIMLLALSKSTGEASESPYWEAMEEVTRYSDNEAANRLLEMAGGSEVEGAAEMVTLMRSLGLTHSYMAGGYLIDGGGGSLLLGVVDQPPSAYKYTTAGDMGTLAAILVDAAAGTGPLLRHGITRHEARELLYLMLHAESAGLVKAGAHGLPVAHKIGWLQDSDNDVAVIFTPHGPLAVAIYSSGSEDGTELLFGEEAVSALLATEQVG